MTLRELVIMAHGKRVHDWHRTAWELWHVAALWGAAKSGSDIQAFSPYPLGMTPKRKGKTAAEIKAIYQSLKGSKHASNRNRVDGDRSGGSE